jgi:hypothetical protein
MASTAPSGNSRRTTTSETRDLGGRCSSGHVLDDQDGPLAAAVVANANGLKRLTIEAGRSRAPANPSEVYGYALVQYPD